MSKKNLALYIAFALIVVIVAMLLWKDIRAGKTGSLSPSEKESVMASLTAPGESILSQEEEKKVLESLTAPRDKVSGKALQDE